jgi:hypothetical protein
MEARKRILLLLMAAFWVVVMNRGVQAAHVCGDVCDGASCDAECWATQFDYDNNYPSTTCGAQNYSCCGDGVCDSGSEYCGSCTEDCGSSPTCASECTWSFQCAIGEVCNPSHQCVVPAPNNGGTGASSCSNKGDCYTPDACMSSGECAIPHSDECDAGYSCSNSEWCSENIVSNSYCNPGNNKCMYTDQPGCPLPPR